MYIYIHIHTWDDYHIFLIATLVFTRLLVDEIYHLIELLFDCWWYDIDFCLLAYWVDFRFCYSYLTWKTGGLELASTIVLVLQANRLTKWAIHPGIELYVEGIAYSVCELVSKIPNCKELNQFTANYEISSKIGLFYALVTSDFDLGQYSPQNIWQVPESTTHLRMEGI